MWKKVNVALFAASIGTFVVPAAAEELDAQAAAGKIIFEETAGDVGCAACHGMTAQGDIGPNIVGRDASAIQTQLSGNEQMSFIQLTPEQIEQVAAYLSYLDS